MPVVHVRSLRAPDAALFDAIAAGVAAETDGDPAGVWVTHTRLDAMSVGGRQRTAGAGDVAFVEVLTRLPDPEAVLRAVARATSEALSLPAEDVWIHHTALRPREVHAGGDVLEWG